MPVNERACIALSKRGLLSRFRRDQVGRTRTCSRKSTPLDVLSRCSTLGWEPAPTRDGVLRTPAQLCYFDSTGKAVSRDVDNAGELLARLRPDDIEDG
jgi:hypothetical protein